MDATKLDDQVVPPSSSGDGVVPVAPPLPSEVKTPTPPGNALNSFATQPQPLSDLSSSNTPAFPPEPFATTEDLPIAPPTSSEVPPEAPFPGQQPLPEAEQEKLEQQAQQIISSNGGLPPSKATKSRIMQSVLGVLALVLVGAGVFFGQQLVTTGGIGDIRQQAAIGDDHSCQNESDCSSSETCVKGICQDSAKFECSIGDPNACGGRPEACHCLYGDTCDGTKCDPWLADNCEQWGREWCDNYQGFGKTCCEEGYVCASDAGCVPGGGGGGGGGGGDDPTPPPETHLECRNYACAEVVGGGADTCANDSDCLNPSLVCDGLSSSVVAPELGETVRYTCEGTASPGSIHHYAFQYKIGSGEYSVLAEEGAGSGQSAPLTITEAGSYTVRCRACKSSDDTNCSAWQSL